MKRKHIVLVFTLICCAICAVGLVACDKTEYVSCSVTMPEFYVQVHVGDVRVANGNTQVDGSQIVKGKETDVRISFDDYYELNDVKMFINGQEQSLSEVQPTCMPASSDIRAQVHVYSCKYTPTQDMEITFSGTPKLETTSLTFSALSWEHFFADNYSADEKDKLLDNVRFKVLVNDVAISQYNGILLRSFANAAPVGPIAVSKTDKVEFVLYTANGEHLVSVDSSAHWVRIAGDADWAVATNNYFAEEEYENGDEKGVKYKAESFIAADEITVFIL